MSPNYPPKDPWRGPVLGLWLVFFLLGLWPEFTFYLFRTAGYVFSQNAIINSYNFITWSLTGFLGYFVYQRCLEAGLPPVESLGKAFQLGILAFVAFIDLPLEQISDIPNMGDRLLVLSTVGLKLIVWLYLYSLLFRYYWKGDPRTISGALPYFALVSENSAPAAPEKKDTETSEPEKRSSIENPAD